MIGLITLLIALTYGATCDPAITGCAECDEGTPQKCTACLDGYYNSGSDDAVECTACDTTCAKCSGAGADKCTECASNLFPTKDGETITKCSACTEAKEYHDTECKTCGTHQKANNDHTACECETGYQGEQCDTCASGYAKETAESTTCVECTGDNKHINADGVCITCTAPKTNWVDNECKCETGYTGEQCNTCDEANNYAKPTADATTCVKCTGDNKHINNGVCVEDTTTCEVENCKTCVEGKTNECATCNDGYKVNNKQCEKEKCKKGEGHCTECDECGNTCYCCEKGYKNTGIKCTDCDAGYVKDGENCVKCEDEGCVECDAKGKKQCTKCESGYTLKDRQCINCAKHCSYCYTSGEGKCDEEKYCDKKYYLDTTSQTCKECTDKHCYKCSGEGEGKCTECKPGYYWDTEKKSCKKYDCSKNERVHCGLCESAEATATCLECEDGYKEDNYQTDNTKKCIEEGKLTKCEWTDEQCGKKGEEHKERYQEDVCYLEYVGSTKSYKIESGKKCHYTDDKCETRVKKPEYLDVTDKCIRLKDKKVNKGNKCYKMKSGDKCETEVKEYDVDEGTENDDDPKCSCNGEGKSTFTPKCRKVEEGEYEDKFVYTVVGSSGKFPLYTDEDCTKPLEKGDAECEKLPCTGSGSVMNIIMVAILIISFMI